MARIVRPPVDRMIMTWIRQPHCSTAAASRFRMRPQKRLRQAGDQPAAMALVRMSRFPARIRSATALRRPTIDVLPAWIMEVILTIVDMIGVLARGHTKQGRDQRERHD
ncbi:MAG: hypothetical protein WD969_00295 [Paracoccaceae bacterium]